ncbi:MAG: DinB family protein [Clostridia bacterium]|nr:DinB family protein [Clostridia bacterium]
MPKCAEAAWANHRVLDAAAALSEDAFRRELVSSFPSVRDTLVHIMAAEALWLERWRGRSPSALWPPADFPDVAAVRGRWQVVEAEMEAFLEGVDDAVLVGEFTYATTSGRTYTQPSGRRFSTCSTTAPTTVARWRRCSASWA